MVMHARSGGNLEIMGLVQGKFDAHSIIIMDSFALPVEGTETRVNAQAQVKYIFYYLFEIFETNILLTNWDVPLRIVLTLP